jgi:hypothetical protein
MYEGLIMNNVQHRIRTPWPIPTYGGCGSNYSQYYYGFKYAIIGIAILCCLISFAAAQDTPFPPQIHPWATFEPGSWKLVRVLSESFNEKGNVTGTNVSDSKTTLLDTDDDSITLEMKVTVEMAGKRFDREPQTIKQSFFGEQQSASVKVKEPTSGQVVIEDRKIPCQVREIESSSANGKTVTTIFFSTSVSPYVLKRDSISTDQDGKNVLSETHVSVVAMDLPYKILGCLHSSAHVKTEQKTQKGTAVTLSIICPDIPGGVVSHTSKELDPAGHIIRRSTLELIDFNAASENDRSSYSRKRSTRYRTK